MNNINMTREDLISYGYDYVNMLAVTKEQGLEILQRGCCTVYLLYKDGTEYVAEDPQEINDHVQRGGIVGVELDVVRTMEYALILNGDYDDDLKWNPDKIAGTCSQVFGWKTDRDVYEGYMELVQTHKTAFKEKKAMMIDSKVLREKLNDPSIIDWFDEDKSPPLYKQGFLSGMIKALAILGEVEYFTEHGKDREPISFEFDEDTVKGLQAVTGAVSDKLKELELLSHSEKDIVEACIGLMEGVHGQLMEYMEMMGVEHTEGIPSLHYTYFEIVQTLLLMRTGHSGGTSTVAKCRQLEIDPYGEVVIGEGEDED